MLAYVNLSKRWISFVNDAELCFFYLHQVWVFPRTRIIKLRCIDFINVWLYG